MNQHLRDLARHGIRLLVTILAAAASVPVAAQAGYPTGPVRLVVPFTAGGGTDSVARVVSQSLGKRLGQQVVVDNRAGGAGAIGTLAVTQSAGDGHNLLLGSNGTMVLNPLLHSSLKYSVERDLVPVASIASVPYLIVAHPQFPARDIMGLIDLARAKPGQITFASPGSGTTNHLVGVLLQSMTKTDMNHVPYRGAAPAMNDVVSGQVNFMSGDLGTLVPMVKAGKLRALAVTGSKRVAALPDVPTVAETLAGFEATGWFGIFAPKSTPRPVIDRLATEIAQAVAGPAVVQRLEEIGGVPLILNSDQLGHLVVTESAKWKKVITENRVTADALQ